MILWKQEFFDDSPWNYNHQRHNHGLAWRLSQAGVSISRSCCPAVWNLHMRSRETSRYPGVSLLASGILTGYLIDHIQPATPVNTNESSPNTVAAVNVPNGPAQKSSAPDQTLSPTRDAAKSFCDCQTMFTGRTSSLNLHRELRKQLYRSVTRKMM